MDDEILRKFDDMQEVLNRIEVNCALTKGRVEGMKTNIRIGHVLLFALLAGSGVSMFIL